MHLLQRYRNAVGWAALIGCGLISPLTHAVTLNFSANISAGTCSLSLDKSTLSLGDVSLAQLGANQLVSLRAFHLEVKNCINGATATTSASVKITGEGAFQDGKWLFRKSDSSNNSVGVMLIKSDTAPEYSQKEIQNNDVIPLADPGQNPVDQSLTFYAGVSCGSSASCAAVQPGTVTANLIFDFIYQ